MTAPRPDEEDVQHWLKLITATRERLNVLEEQIARMGPSAPPHVQTEAIQARKDIELYRARLVTVQPSEKANNAVGGNAHEILVDYRLTRLEKKVDDGLATVYETVTANNARAEEWRRNEREFRVERQQEHDERLTEIERNAATTADLTYRIADRLNGMTLRIAGIVVLALLVGLLIAKGLGL